MKNHLSVPVRNQSLRRRASLKNDGSADPRLLELVRLRVAQIHQCPISIARHQEELEGKGETKRRLDELETWVTSALFDESERAALALCEKITVDSAHPIPEHLIQEVRHHFTKGAILSLTMAIIAVNDWNLLGNH